MHTARYFILCFGLCSLAAAAGIESKDVAEKRLSLVDKKKIEIYDLGKTGIVRVTIGVKGGPMAGPVYEWKVEDGQLVLFQRAAVRERFQLVERTASTLKLRRRDGEEVVFELTSSK